MNSSSTFTDMNLGIKSTVENISKAGWNDMLAGISWTNKTNDNLKIQTNIFYQNFLTESTGEIHSVIYDTINITEDAINKNSSLIKEFGLTNDYEIRVGGHNLNFGIFSYFRTISPVVGTYLYENGELTNNPDAINNPKTSYLQVESGVYFEDQYTINNKTTIRPGIRLSVLTDFKSNFISPEPRLFISHKLNDKFSLMGSYTITTQSIHRVSSSNAMVVNDLWLPAKKGIKPSKSYQSEFGVFYNSGRFFQAEVNFYNKQMKDLSIYKEGASFVLYPRWEDNITTAIGKSYGAEFLVQAHLKNTFILLAYTLSKTTRQAPDVNGGKVFNYRYDKPHNLNLTIGYRANRKLSLSCNWVIQSGNMISFYDRIIQTDYLYIPIPFIDKLNNIRFPVYHRLDLGLERRTTTKWGKKILKFDIYNVYSKLNPWYLTTNNGNIEQVTLFPIVPSVSYRVEF
jgi:outer membrane receptor for ferrienterochelin and colicin